MKLSAREYCSQTITQKPLHHRRPISDNGYWENYNVSEEGGTQTHHTLTLTQSSPQDGLIRARHRRWPGINSVKLKIGKREMSAVVRILKTNLWRGVEKRSTLRNDSSKPHENKTYYPSLQQMKDRCDYLLKDKMMSYKFLPCGCHSCLIVAWHNHTCSGICSDRDNSATVSFWHQRNTKIWHTVLYRLITHAIWSCGNLHGPKTCKNVSEYNAHWQTLHPKGLLASLNQKRWSQNIL